MTPSQPKLIQKLKGHAGALLSQSIPIIDSAERKKGFLVPITMSCIKDKKVSSKLYEWRERNTSQFLSCFKNSPARTRIWLEKDVMVDPTRLPFLIYDNDQALVGNCGVCKVKQGAAELDTMMRGSSRGGADIMTLAQTALVHWIFSALSVETISGRILSSNFLALRFHRDFGFQETSRIPLCKELTTDGYRLIESPDSTEPENNLYLVNKKIDRSRFYSLYPWTKALPVAPGFLSD